MATDQGKRRPAIEVLYVQDCPHYRGTMALVEQVSAELGIDAELRTSLIVDQAAADQARSPGASRPPNTPWAAASTGSSTASPANPRSAGSARHCCGRPAAAERPPAVLPGEGGGRLGTGRYCSERRGPPDGCRP